MLNINFLQWWLSKNLYKSFVSRDRLSIDTERKD